MVALSGGRRRERSEEKEEAVMSIGSIIAIVFTVILTIALPVGAMLWLWPRGGRWPVFLVGAATFVLFAMVLEQGLHYLVLMSPMGGRIRNNIWLYAFYGGLAAGVFEETGRFVAFKCFLKKRTEPVTALCCGLGHGGAEAFLVVGLTMIGNLALAALADSGSLTDPSLAAMAETVKATPAALFLWAGFERVVAIALHTANSVLVFAAANRPGKFRLFPLAIVTHAGANFIAAVANQFCSVAVTELLVLVFTALVVLLAAGVYRNLCGSEENT